MIRILALCFFCMGIGSASASSFTFNILGYDYEDSNKVNLEVVYQKVISKSTYLREGGGIEKGYPKVKKSDNKTGVFLLSVLLLYAFAGIRLMFSHQFSGSLDLLKSFRNQKKGQPETDSISLLSFYGLFLLTLGYATYNYLVSYKAMLTGLPIIAGVILCCSVVMVLFVLKILLMCMVAWSFDKKQVLSHYFLRVSMIYKVAAIVLFPLSILFLISSGAVATLVLKLTLALLILMVFVRYLLNVGHIKKLLAVHFFHFILYLCAFEIIPLMVLYKWLS